MSNLFGTMSTSVQSLLAHQAALEITSDNIANVNTPGYCRRRAVLEEDTTTLSGGSSQGGGLHFKGVQSLRDQVLDLRIGQETQEHSALDAFVNAMSPVESEFTDLENGIGARIDKFFSSLAAMETDPTNIPKRQNVLIAAGNLTNSFQSTAQNLKSIQLNLDTSIVQHLASVNQLTAQIAALNVQVAKEKLEGEAGAAQDQQTELTRQLCEQIDVSVIQSDDGLTLTTKSGALLVAGSKSFDLSSFPSSSGLREIVANGKDITADISGGAIGGLLEARDQAIPSILGELNQLASGLATAVNDSNRKGFDLAGNPGANIFAISTPLDAAASITVAMSDPRGIALSSDGSEGDNGNLGNFEAIRHGNTISGYAPVDFYSSSVARVGNTVATAQSNADASDMALRQLQNQRGAISGVSLDEEAANMIRLQRAFEASARVFTVVDEMLQTVLAMGQQ